MIVVMERKALDAVQLLVDKIYCCARGVFDAIRVLDFDFFPCRSETFLLIVYVRPQADVVVYPAGEISHDQKDEVEIRMPVTLAHLSHEFGQFRHEVEWLVPVDFEIDVIFNLVRLGLHTYEEVCKLTQSINKCVRGTDPIGDGVEFQKRSQVG